MWEYLDKMWENLLDGKAHLVLRKKMLTDAGSLEWLVGLLQKGCVR